MVPYPDPTPAFQSCRDSPLTPDTCSSAWRSKPHPSFVLSAFPLSSLTCIPPLFPPSHLLSSWLQSALSLPLLFSSLLLSIYFYLFIWLCWVLVGARGIFSLHYGMRNVLAVICKLLGFPGGSSGKESVYNAGAQEKLVWSLGQGDLLGEEMATYSSILAWEVPWTEEPGGLQSMGSQRVRHDSVTKK